MSRLFVWPTPSLRGPVPFRDPNGFVNIHGYHPSQPNQITVYCALTRGGARDQIVRYRPLLVGLGSVIESDDRVESAGIARVSPAHHRTRRARARSRVHRRRCRPAYGDSERQARASALRVRMTRSADLIRIDGEAHTIVGYVAPRGFAFPQHQVRLAAGDGRAAADARSRNCQNPFEPDVRAGGGAHRYDLPRSRRSGGASGSRRSRARLPAHLRPLSRGACRDAVPADGRGRTPISFWPRRSSVEARWRSVEPGEPFALIRQIVVEVALRSMSAAVLALIKLVAIVSRYDCTVSHAY